MREIDFLPQWYRAGQKRRIWYQRQYLVLAVAAALLGLWFFTAGKSLALAYAELRTAQADFESGVQKVQRYKQLQQKLAVLESRTDVLNAITPRTQLSPALAELSAAVNSNVILSRVEFSQEGFEKKDKNTDGSARVLVQIDSGTQQDKAGAVGREPLRTKVILAGVAAGGAEVARLISQLEGSLYFCRIQPIFSRDKKVKSYDVTEFEIHLYIADYEQTQDKEQI